MRELPETHARPILPTGGPHLPDLVPGTWEGIPTLPNL